jgi:hypothetical protein
LVIVNPHLPNATIQFSKNHFIKKRPQHFKWELTNVKLPFLPNPFEEGIEIERWILCGGRN